MAMPRARSLLLPAAAAAAWIAIGIGAFQQLYVTIHFTDRAALSKYWSEAQYSRIPGLREMLLEVEQRTKPGDRVLIWTPHHPWQQGYGYAFRRAQYILSGREVIPFLDRERDVVDESSIARAEFIACWRDCPRFDGFAPAWRSADGMLLRRVR